MYKYSTSMLRVLNNTAIPELGKFTLSKPAKISNKAKSAFSLPAGPEFSCPGATKACDGCYAQKGRHVFNSVQSAFARNWLLLKRYEEYNEGPHGAAQAIAKSIPKNRNVFRIYESGDFHSQWVVNVWEYVARQRDTIEFWAYTRSFDFDYGRLLRQSNFTLWASTDEYNKKEAKAFVKKYKGLGVKHAYGPWDHDTPVPANSFVCPVTSGKMKVDGACEKCMLCVSRNRVSKNVVFLAH